MKQNITPEVEKIIKYFYDQRYRGIEAKENGIMVFGVWLVVPILFFIMWLFGVDIFNKTNIWITCIAIPIIWVPSVLYYFKSKRAKWIQNAKKVYQNGQKIPLKLHSVNATNAYKHITPQKMIVLLAGNEYVKIKTYNSYIVQIFSIPEQFGYQDSRYPKILLPEAMFTKEFYDPNFDTSPISKAKSI